MGLKEAFLKLHFINISFMIFSLVQHSHQTSGFGQSLYPNPAKVLDPDPAKNSEPDPAKVLDPA
jgi:hypothetical protein